MNRYPGYAGTDADWPSSYRGSPYNSNIVATTTVLPPEVVRAINRRKCIGATNRREELRLALVPVRATGYFAGQAQLQFLALAFNQTTTTCSELACRLLCA
eukprot:1489357-Rhodomonas_salina.3